MRAQSAFDSNAVLDINRSSSHYTPSLRRHALTPVLSLESKLSPELDRTTGGRTGRKAEFDVPGCSLGSHFPNVDAWAFHCRAFD